MKVKIEFLSWDGKAALEVEAESVKEAVESAVRSGATLYGADLRGAKLRGADLRGADLHGANLRGADLHGATIYGADLRGAKLCGANLRGADLRGANLYAADLHGATIYGANLRGANLYGADLRGAKYGARVLWHKRPVLQLGPCGSVDRTTVIFFFEDGGEPLIRCGCFCGNVAEFEAKIHDTHCGTFHGVEYMATVAHIKAIHEIQKETK